MREKIISNPLKALWLSCCLGVLLVTFMRQDDKDIGIIFVYVMSILAFPSGIIVVMVVAWAAAMLASNSVSSSPDPFIQEIAGIVIWAFITVAGYIQWFVLVPWVWKKWKSRSLNRS
ncbi:hypothetical protein [Thauera sinica]|uniref:Uncharacterized protein n=1 Tax=Thauera sinica TaxID=2665146 RepID=A0ABW1APQ8_9RHOO|nr:hypothetical protein [Thauera sp. K11]